MMIRWLSNKTYTSTELHTSNFGEEGKRVRAMDCLCMTVARRYSAAARTVAELTERERRVTPCGGFVATVRATAHGRFSIDPLCEVHLREAGALPGTKRRGEFEIRYGIDLIAEADRIALEHPEPLGIRGLVRRWVAWHGVEPKSSHTAAYLQLDTYETEALMKWVRREMAAKVAEREADGRDPDGDNDACVLAVALAIGGPLLGSYESVDLAWTLCDAAAGPS